MEVENRELTEDLKTVTSARAEADAKRRRIESNLQEANARLQDAERIKMEQASRIEKAERDYEGEFYFSIKEIK